jgi:hypothetical protein
LSPYNNSWQKFVFLESFLLRITNGGNLWPSAVIANITVHCCLSTPVVQTSTDLSPACSIIVRSSMSNHIVVWSLFPVWERR